MIENLVDSAKKFTADPFKIAAKSLLIVLKS